MITAEAFLPVSFVLLVRAGTALDGVKTVATHPHAEAQCRRWLRRNLPRAEVVLAGSTAAAAAGVAAGDFDAAVSAPIAASHYQLTALATDLADNPGAVTRFVLLTPPAPPPAPTGLDKTSLVAFIRDDHTGALLEVLTEFAVRGINLTRIESRPLRRGLGRYMFFIDLEGSAKEPGVCEAIVALRSKAESVRVLGTYPLSGPGIPGS